jgi:hypothetical protein
MRVPTRPCRTGDACPRPQFSFSVERGSGCEARGVFPFDRRLTCRRRSSTTARPIAAFAKNPGGAEPLRPAIRMTTTINASPAVPTVVEDRRADLRSFSARFSYLFMACRFQLISSRTAWAAVAHRAAHQVLEQRRIFLDPHLRCAFSAVMNPTKPAQTQGLWTLAKYQSSTRRQLEQFLRGRMPDGGRPI